MIQWSSKLYCCSKNFKKPFDMVPCEHMWKCMEEEKYIVIPKTSRKPLIKCLVSICGSTCKKSRYQWFPHLKKKKKVLHNTHVILCLKCDPPHLSQAMNASLAEECIVALWTKCHASDFHPFRTQIFSFRWHFYLILMSWS